MSCIAAMQHGMLRRNKSDIIYLYQRFRKRCLKALLKPLQEIIMATTAPITGFDTTATRRQGRSGPALLHGLMLAFEARAIYRLEQEAGHLLSEESLRSMKAEYNKRRAALAH
jgi:hypothetical protein